MDQGRLADRVGDHGTRRAGADELNGPFDRPLNRGRRGGVRASGNHIAGDRDGQHRQGLGKERGASLASPTVFISMSRSSARARSASTLGSPINTKGGTGALPTRLKGKKGYVGANPGGIAEREGKRSFGTVHCDPAIGKTLRSDFSAAAQGSTPGLCDWRSVFRPIRRPRHPKPRSPVLDERVLAHVAQQAFGPDPELLFHELHLGLLPFLRIALDGVLAANRVSLDGRAGEGGGVI